MGIPHLISYLRPYADREELSGTAVIDGPGLAYHIYFICLSTRPYISNPYEAAPSYQEIGDATIEWLHGLETSGVSIKRIFFDGHLPASKLTTRLERLRIQTKRLANFHQSNSAPCRLVKPPKPIPLSLFAPSTTQKALIGFPPVLFLVPAVIEALLSHSRFGKLISVVPGEADLFCAAYLEKHGGIVFTGDSDLLVHGLGPNGGVSFFKDIESSGDRHGVLSGLVYRTADIAKRLSLPEPGLQSLAFEMVMDPHGAFKKLVSEAVSKAAVKSYPQDYSKFSREYTLPLSISQLESKYHELRAALQTLDPRTSEFVMHFQSLAHAAGHDITTSSDPPHVFLPFLLGCPTCTNAWEMSTSVRQLAYGLVNLIVPESERRSSVSEHRRQQSDFGAKEWQLPNVTEIPDACNFLIDLLTKIKEKLPLNATAGDLFLAVAVHQDLDYSSSASKQSLAQPVLQHFLQGIDHEAFRLKPCSWDIVQYLAQLQGSFYSFRILNQLLNLVCNDITKELPRPVRLLYRLILDLPSLTEYPELSRMVRVAKKIRAMNMVKIACAILGVEDQGETKKASKKSRSKKRKANTALSSNVVKSSNPFDVLGN